MTPNIRFSLLITSLFCVLATSPATAATIGFNPSDQTIDLAQSTTVDVVVSGLAGEIVSAYDLDIRYDSDIATATGVSFTSSLGDEFFFEVLNSSVISTPGLVDLAQVSFLSDDDLFAQQGGNAVSVASVTFEAIGVGSTNLDFVFDNVNDIKGRFGAILSVDSNRGIIRVRGSTNPVPEPSAAALYLVGALVVARSLRRRSGSLRGGGDRRRTENRR